MKNKMNIATDIIFSIINIGAIFYSVKMFSQNSDLISGQFFWTFITLWLMKKLTSTADDIIGAFK